MARHWTRTISFTRPANTTAYTAGDAVSDSATAPTLATFTVSDLGAAPSFGGRITSVYLHKSGANLTNASFAVNVLNAAPVNTGLDDNVALAITDAEWQAGLGHVPLVTGTDSQDVVTGVIYTKSALTIGYQLSSASPSLYFVLSALAAYTPASGEVFTLRVSGITDD